MACRNFTSNPSFCLVYFDSDKTTSIVQTKTLRNKETEKQFIDFEPEKKSYVSLKHKGKTLEAMVIAVSGKFLCDNVL